MKLVSESGVANAEAPPDRMPFATAGPDPPFVATVGEAVLMFACGHHAVRSPCARRGGAAG